MNNSDNIGIKLKEKYALILYNWLSYNKNKISDEYLYIIIPYLWEISKLNKSDEANFENWVNNILYENKIDQQLYNKIIILIRNLNLYLKKYKINDYRNKRIVHSDLTFDNCAIYIGPKTKNGYIDSTNQLVKKFNSCRPLINYYIITQAIIYCKQIFNKIENTHSFYLNNINSLSDVTSNTLLLKYKKHK